MPVCCCSSRSRSRICACTVTSSAVVGSSAISRSGVAGQRHGDHHALAHAAGHLVRIFVEAALRARGCARGRSASIARLRSAGAGCRAVVRAHRLGDLVADGEHRVQAGHRLLEDHRDARCRGSRASRPSAGVSRSRPSNIDPPGGDAARAAAPGASPRATASTCRSRFRRRCRACAPLATDSDTPSTAATSPAAVRNTVRRPSIESRSVMARPIARQGL